MNIDLSRLVSRDETIAVALSGGCDSMVLLHFLLANKSKYGYNVIALNVEHGIRGEESLSDTKFVNDYCKAVNIPILNYSIDTIAYSKKNNLSVEEGARKLRYQCFNDAIDNKKCDKVATAHHLGDNFESILLNLFRGTGIKGLTGITENFANRIIRPLVSVSKQEILEYAKKYNIPYVTDSSNLCDDYTRNYLRLNVIPEIKDIFPEAESSAFRLSQILKSYEDCLGKITETIIKKNDDAIEIALPNDEVLISRATIIAMKMLGIEKDWQKVHADEILKLATLPNGAKISLPQGIIAIKEYDKICFYREKNVTLDTISFGIKDFTFGGKTYSIKKCDIPKDIKAGLFADLDKIPKDAVIRTKQDGDVFTKFGGGTKKLNDYLTDKKVPLRQRAGIPVLAKNNVVYLIFGISISDQIKIDKNSQNIVQFF